MAICKKCGARVPDTEQACPKCGEKIARRGRGTGLIGGGLIGDSMLERRKPASTGELIGVGPTTYGDEVSFVGGADALRQVKNIKVSDLTESEFASITNQMNTMLTQMGVPLTIDKETKLNLMRGDRQLVTLIGAKINEAHQAYGRYVGAPETYLRLGNAVYLTRRGYDEAMAKGEVIPIDEKAFNYEVASAYYTGAIELKPDYEEAWNNKGNALYSLGKVDDAIKCYDKAIEIHPEYAEAWNNKGTALKKKGLEDEALRCYNRAIEIDSEYKDAWMNKGNTLFNQKLLGDALKCYEKVIGLDADNADAWVNKGNTLRLMNRADEASKSYDRALQLNPSSADAKTGKAALVKK